MTKNVTERVREHRQRMREKGLVKKDVWILPEHSKTLNIAETFLRNENTKSYTYTSGKGLSIENINSVLD